MYWDLELRDDEAFTVLSVTQLHHIATALGTSASQLLFGDDLQPPSQGPDFGTIAERLRLRLKEEGLTSETLSEQVGWELNGMLSNPETIGDLNVQGLRDVCNAASIDWVGAFLLAGAGRPTRG